MEEGHGKKTNELVTRPITKPHSVVMKSRVGKRGGVGDDSASERRLRAPPLRFILLVWVSFSAAIQLLCVALAAADEGGIARRTRNRSRSLSGNLRCPCRVLERPETWQKALVARWMAHSLDWGVVTTVSSRTSSNSGRAELPVPFGNVYSFVDGPCDNSTGIPYFYATYMDQTLQDMRHNPSAALTLSEASFASVCQPSSEGDETEGTASRTLPACSVSADVETSGGKARYGDPESPLCARLTLTGTLVQVERESDEFQWALQALYQRHRQMRDWPIDHNWVIVKLDVQDVWFIDYFGGANIVSVPDYLSAQLLPPEETGVH